MNTTDTQTTDGVVRRYAAAWAIGDVTTLIEIYATDVIAHYGGTSEFAGTHRGRDAFLTVLATSSARSKRRLLSVDQVHDDGMGGAIFATETVTIDGTEVTVQRALRYRTTDTHITELWLYDLDQHHVDQAWR